LTGGTKKLYSLDHKEKFEETKGVITSRK